MKNTTLIFRSVSWLLLYQAVSFFVGIIVTIAMVRYMGNIGFGQYSYVLSIASIFSVLSNFGYDRVVIRELVENPHDKTEILGSVFLLRVAGGILALVIGFFSLVYMNKVELALLLVFFSTSHLIWSLSLDVFFQSKIKSNVIFFAKISGVIASASVKILLIYKQSEVIYFGLASVFEMFCAVVVYTCFYRFGFGEKISFYLSRKYVGRIFSSAWPIALSTLSGVIYTQIDKIMLGNMVDLKSVGVYSVYVQFVVYLGIVIAAINQTVTPILIKSKYQNEEQFVKRAAITLGLNAWIGILLCIFSFLFGEYIIEILFGKEFSGYEIILLVLVFGFLIHTPATLRTEYLVMIKRTDIALIFRLVSVFLNIILNFILIPKYGMLGAAIATFFTILIYDVLMNFTYVETREYMKLYIRGVRYAIGQKIPMLIWSKVK